MASSFPAWQTDDLAEEWIEEESEEQEYPDGEHNTSVRPKDIDDEYNISMSSHGTRDLSFTEPLASYIQRTGTWEANGSLAAPGSAAASRANSPAPMGTFLVREDMPAMPLQAMLPKTPGRNKTGIVKDIFSPTALERMFEPPSPPSAPPTSSPSPSSAPRPEVHTPAMSRVVIGGMASLPRSTAPAIPSRLAQTFVPPSESSVNSSHAHSSDEDITESQHLMDSWNAPLTEEPLPSGASSSTHSTAARTLGAAAAATTTLAPPDQKFTFAVPRMTPQPSALFVPPSPMPQFNPEKFSQAQSTPGPPIRMGAVSVGPPLTDPRLRLFQFNYDTYTREQLSAMVDSIAVNTPTVSGDGWSPSTHYGTPKPAMHSSSEASFADLRSTKRVKLSSAEDLVSELGEGLEGQGVSVIEGQGARKGENGTGCEDYTQDLSREDTFYAQESTGSSQRPKVTVKDRVGDARSLFDQIRQARDFSTVSSAASGQSMAMRRSTNDDDTSPLSSTCKQETWS
jgi:protein NUD1